MIATDIGPPWSSAEALTAWATLALALGIFLALWSARIALKMYRLEAVPLISIEPILKISKDQASSIIPRLTIARLPKTSHFHIGTSTPGIGTGGLYVKVANVGRSPVVGLQLKLSVSQAVIAEGIEIPPRRDAEWVYIGTIPANDSLTISVINMLDIYVSVTLLEGRHNPDPRAKKGETINVVGGRGIIVHDSKAMRSVNSRDWVADGMVANQSSEQLLDSDR